MSYIRSGSNPEHLYIWGDGYNVYVGKGSEEYVTIPSKIFKGLIKQYKKNGDFTANYLGAKIEEEWVLIGEPPKNEFQIKLSYKDWHCYMWLVTWEYICQGR